MKRLGLVAVLSAAALAGCGGGDDDTGGGGEAGGTPDRRPAETGSTNAPQRIEMREFAFLPGDVQVERGDGLLAVNVGQTPHNLTFEEGGGGGEAGRRLAATSDLAADAMERLPVEVAPGEYTLVCTLPGHRDAGMVGKIVVE